MKTHRFGAFGGALLGLFLCREASGLDAAADPRPASPRDFGVENVNVLAIPAASFSAQTSATTWTMGLAGSAAGYRYPVGGLGQFVAGFSLPEGARIDEVVLYYDDTDSDDQVDATLYRLTGFDEATAGIEVITIASSNTSTGKNFRFSPAVAHTVSNTVFLGGGQYLVAVTCGSPETGFRAVEIWWERQMSPAPAIATFADVPTSHPFFRAIEALAASGITSGCGGNNFCPNQPVTRGEVAKFFARALGLSFNNNVF